MKKVLITTSHNRLTGVTTFNYTLAARLKELGYDLHIYIATIESKSTIVQDEFKKLGKVFYYDQAPLYQYDHLIFSDSLTQDRFKNYSGQKIFIVHGLEEKYFTPIVDDCDFIFCVSPFMTETYQAKLPDFKVHYLPNLIDTNRFHIRSQVSNQLRSALVMDFRFGTTYGNELRKLAKKHGFRLTLHSSQDTLNQIWKIEDLIFEHDLVFAYGRSAYEAMACGRNVIVFGRNGGDGFMDLETLPKSFERNCSGWGIRSLPKDLGAHLDLMEKEILKYDPHIGLSLHKEIHARTSVDLQIQSFIDIVSL